MVMDIVTNSSAGPLLELATQIMEAIIEMVVASENVLVGKKCFVELSSYLERIVPFLKELSGKGIAASEGVENFIKILDKQTMDAKKLIRDCSERNRIYLLVNSRSIAKNIEAITKDISRAIGCILLSSLDISVKIREDIDQLICDMQNAKFKAAVAEEEILEKIESGIQERNVDRSYANELFVSIAKAVGVSTDRSSLRKEFDEFKIEIENLWSRKDKAEAIQMDQIIALLERADIASSLVDKEKKYLSKRMSLGVQPLEALMSFYCPISREVMIDPVETPSGHTFERSAIEKWLSEADEPSCPITSNPLDISMLRPNKTLRQSIEEWRDRNNMIMVASLKPRLSSENEEDVLHCLEQVKDLCEQREVKEWLILDHYIPILVKLLGVKNRDIKNHALRMLYLLVKDNDDAKKITATVENSIEKIVQFLGRRIGERKSAVALLLELSTCESVRDGIGKVQGCILLLVTMLSNTDPQAARDAQMVLDNLSYSDDNVVLMAKNNYFTYLLGRLSSGSDEVKMTMAKTLGEMELTDHRKAALVESGVLDLLLVLVSHDDVEMKTVAVQALLNLSSLEKNGQEIIKKGSVRPLLDILYRQTFSRRLHELVAATIVHLALSTIPKEGSASDSEPVLMLETGEEIVELFSFTTLTVPALQQDIFRAFHAMCLSPSADLVKSKLRECSAVQMLFRLCEIDDAILRANAVKLLHCLTDGEDGTAVIEHVTQASVESLLKIVKTSNDVEEVASALGTIACLPETPEISGWLLESRHLQTVFDLLPGGGNSVHQKPQLLGNAVGAIRRLTIQTSLPLQKKVAEAGVIPLMVRLLESGTNTTIKRAAISLAQLSQSSLRLTRQISRRQSLWCFSLPEAACPVHHGLCTVESSFCLLEANAVEALTRALRSQDTGVCEAALDALLTLIDNERLQDGCKVLAAANAIAAIVKLISSPATSLQEKVLNCLERIFRVEEYKQRYGGAAHMPLVDLTQRGNINLRSLAARILARLDVLHDQSSYF